MYSGLSLWLKVITFIGSQIITFIVSTLLHLRLVCITFMVSVTFMVDNYISG